MKNLSKKFRQLGSKILSVLTQNTTIVFSILILAIFGYMIARVGSLSNPSANDELFRDKIKQIVRVRFNKEAVDKIKVLRDPNVQVDPSLSEDRTNPFNSY